MLVKIQLHDNSEFTAHIENFNLVDFIKTVNESQGRLIQFGNYGIVANMIKIVDGTDIATQE